MDDVLLIVGRCGHAFQDGHEPGVPTFGPSFRLRSIGDARGAVSIEVADGSNGLIVLIEVARQLRAAGFAVLHCSGGQRLETWPLSCTSGK